MGIGCRKRRRGRGEWGNQFNSEHVTLELPMRFPSRDAKEVTGYMRLESISGVEIFVIFSAIRWY